MLIAEPSSSLASIREPATVDIMACLMQSRAPRSISSIGVDDDVIACGGTRLLCAQRLSLLAGVAAAGVALSRSL